MNVFIRLICVCVRVYVFMCVSTCVCGGWYLSLGNDSVAFHFFFFFEAGSDGLASCLRLSLIGWLVWPEAGSDWLASLAGRLILAVHPI